jgi:PAS domain S-box-containing protein
MGTDNHGCSRVPLGIAMVAAEGLRIEFASEAFAAMHGYAAKELIAHRLTECGDPPGGGEIVSHVLSLRDGDARSWRTRHRRRDGTTFPVLVHAAMPGREGGGPGRVVLCVYDDTEKLRSEELKKASDGALDGMAKGLSLEEILTGLVRSAERINPRMLGSVLLLDADGKRLHRGTAPSLPEFYNVAIDGLEIGPRAGSCGTAAFTGRRVVVADVTTHPYWASFRELAERAGLRACWSEPIRSPRGEILGTFAMYYREPREPEPADLEFIATAARIAGIAIERKRAEESLRESREHYRVLVENAPEAIVIFDVDAGRFVDANENAVRLFRLPREALLRTGPIALSPPVQPDGRPSGASARAQIDRALAGGHPHFEWVHRDAEGNDIPCDVRLVRFPSTRHRLIRGSVTDISERKRAEAERRRLEAQILQAQKLESLGVLAGGIAHDFNNLLVGILGNASLALRDLPPESPAQEMIEAIVKAAERAADLAREMLAYSGRGKFVVEPTDVSMLVEEMGHLLEASISKKAVTRYDLGRNLPRIEVDATQLRQVIMNLITNASDALGEGSGLIRIATGMTRVTREELSEMVLHDELEPGDYLFLEVSDTGCGMDPEVLARIFDPFFTTKFAGRGLGLAAVLGIVRGHHGGLQVRSEPGRGTTFRVLFPCQNATRVAFDGEAPRESSHGLDGPATGTILIVDDEEAVRTLVKRILERSAFRVLTARDGREGLECFRAHARDISVVLLDATMPEMSGEETFREMRRIRPDVRVLLSSGYAEKDAARRFARDEIAGFLQKPYRVEQLLAKVRSALRC